MCHWLFRSRQSILYLKIIEAQGEAEANAAKSSQLTDQILKEKFIDKWNGELPKVSGQSESLFDISSILGK